MYSECSLHIKARAKKSKRFNFLISAGATREPIDAVRFISNRSSGFFGCQIAQEAQRRGHRVVLISAPIMWAKPQGVRSIDVQSARQMQDELKRRLSWCDCLIMAAAVADFRTQTVSVRKIKRSQTKEFCLKLKRNPDILKALSRSKGPRTTVGFALETENLRKNAEKKLKEKRLDLIVATQIKKNSYPFGPVKLNTLIIDRDANIQRLRAATKTQLAQVLLSKIEDLLRLAQDKRAA